MSLSVAGFRVRQARVLRSRASGEVANALGWPISKWSRLENSDFSVLDVAVVQAIAVELEFPLDFLVYPESVDLSDKDLLFRASKSMPKREKQYLTDFAAIVGEISTWIDSYHRLPGVRLPHALLRREPLSDIDIAGAAVTARLALGIDADIPVPYLTHSMERAGIVVISRGRGLHPGDEDVFDRDAIALDKHIGYSVWSGLNRDRPLVVMRSISSWERTRWTLAHELGHLMLHRGRISDSAEDEASRFASEFLVPAEKLKHLLPTTLTLRTLLPLKLKWGISLYALLRHMHVSELISKDRYDSLTKQLHVRRNHETGRTWRNDEPGWDARSPEIPGMLRTWFERCLSTTDPNALAAISKVWPADLFAIILSNQRTRQPSVQVPDSIGLGQHLEQRSVVSLDSRRRTSFG